MCLSDQRESQEEKAVGYVVVKKTTAEDGAVTYHPFVQNERLAFKMGERNKAAYFFLNPFVHGAEIQKHSATFFNNGGFHGYRELDAAKMSSWWETMYSPDTGGVIVIELAIVKCKFEEIIATGIEHGSDCVPLKSFRAHYRTIVEEVESKELGAFMW